tara:strand:+ start:1016 stop:1198 length:183 start_codon:yes stop_codon:yes gene_type:complete
MADRQINTWENHEDSFEETLRREMLSARQEMFLLKADLQQLTNSYYKLLRKTQHLKKSDK